MKEMLKACYSGTLAFLLVWIALMTSALADTGNQLTSAQVQKLKSTPPKAKLVIAVPTYLPKGYTVNKVNAVAFPYASGGFDSGYSVDYRGKDGSCFDIRSSSWGNRGMIYKFKVKSKAGTISLFENTGQQGNPSALHAFLPINNGTSVVVTPNLDACNKPLEEEEFLRVLQSVDLLR